MKIKKKREIPIGNVAAEHCYYFCKETCTCTNLACSVDENLWYVKYYLLLLLLYYYIIYYYCYYNYFYHHYYIKIKTMKSCLEIFKRHEYRCLTRFTHYYILFFFINIYSDTHTHTYPATSFLWYIRIIYYKAERIPIETIYVHVSPAMPF